MILHQEGMTDAQEAEAHKVLDLLNTCYPDHPWSVRVAGGVIFIRYLDPDLGGNWGMNLKVSEVYHDAAVLKRRVVSLAGEWLERSGLARGRGTGEEIKWVEGVPDRYQPRQAKPAIDIEKVIAVAQEKARTEPMPQIKQGT